MRQRCDQRLNRRVAAAAFDTDGALADRRQNNLRAQFLTNARRETQALETGAGENDGVVFALIELGQARIHVTAQIAHHQVGPPRAQLALAAQTGRADARALRQVVERGEVIRDEGVARVLAFEDHGQFQAVGQLHRHVFHGMHRDVGAVFQHGLFQFLDEQALAADFGQRAVENLIAAGGHADQFDL